MIARATIVIALGFLCSCATVSLPSGFEPSTVPAATPAVETLEVTLERDVRPFRGRSRVGTGFYAAIPLIPYGHQQFSPEHASLASAIETSGFPGDVSATVVRDLRAAGVAHWVGTADNRLPGQEERHRLSLTLEEGIYHRNVTLYGLSLFGALLWFVGLPSSYGSAELVLSAELFDPSGGSLGTARFSGRARAVEWLYYPFQRAYPPAMPKAYGRLSPALREFVRTAITTGNPGRRELRD